MHRLEHFLLRLTRFLAYAGGLVIAALTLITVYSIVGRTIVKTSWLNSLFFLSWWKPVRGDFELIEIGTALAISSFFPYTQMIRGNVLVDFFTNRADSRVKAGLEVFSNLIFSILSILIAWRMAAGSAEFYSAAFKQTSMILKIPTWLSMFVVTGFMFLLSIVCIFTLLRSILETLGNGEVKGSAE